jgi:hypothetical protein
VASAQHRTPEHRAARKRYTALVKAGQGWCAQPVCVMGSRWIPPGALWDVGHDDSGTVILGPTHRACNRVEAGRKRHRVARRVARWVL